MLSSLICTGASSDAFLLNLATNQKGGLVIIDDGTSSMGSHTKGGLYKTFTDQQSSCTVSGGPRTAEAALAVYTNEAPEVIKEEAVLTRVLPINMAQATYDQTQENPWGLLNNDMDTYRYKVLPHMLRLARSITAPDVERIAQELRERGPVYLKRVAVNIAAITACAVALARSTLGEAVAAQLKSYCLNVWAQRCQELLDSLTPFGAVTCALQALLDSTVTVEVSGGQRLQLPRIVAAGGRFMVLEIEGPSKRAFLVAHSSMAEATSAATEHEFPHSKGELARMFKVAPGLGFFSHQAQTHVFAASSNATGAEAVLTRIISSRASVMVFWVDKLPPALVEALEAAVKLRPNPPGLFKDEAAPGQASSTDEADELDSETSTPELGPAKGARTELMRCCAATSPRPPGMAPAHQLLARPSHELRERS